MASEAWIWDEREGPPRLRRELDEQGFSRFHAPEMLSAASVPLELSERVFGLRPFRLRRQIIQPDRDDPQKRGYWQSTGEARLHTDGPDCGVPPSALLMYCDEPASEGGEVILLDTWAVLREVEAKDAALFEQLFRAPRRLDFGQTAHFGPTFSFRNGHFVCLHPAFVGKGDEVGERFQAFVDAAPRVSFRPRKGDVYVVNNHRCLHGRLAFEDLGRRFFRMMLWFVEPFAAPAAYVDRARAAASRLAKALEGEPLWQRQRFGVAAPVASAEALERLRLALDLFVHPRDTREGDSTEARRQAELQDVLLSACLSALEEERPPRQEREARSAELLGELLRGARAKSKG